ncbi:AI-2E family transporter [Roseobacter sp. OBYS 0001]|uniref:AI-2E family transporter n=1 Tax=Roseobacter sp. OBYS 0001 TaxID=882651 RepID=UPI001BBA4674|nr:AI-2E family transporter [Roseobacter sp. OBYS 0001]GIT86649.1 AI-2E family transporter [Roseobacter sp. OBYS 0001]
MTDESDTSRNGDAVPAAASKRLELAAIGIFCILLLQTLVWASDFLIPVTAAFLGYFVLNRPRRWLAKAGVAPAVSAGLFTAILAAFIVVLLVQLSAPAAQFIEDLPSLMEQIKEKLSASGGTLEAINDATVAAEEIIADQGAETVAVEVVSNTGVAATIFSMAPGFLSRILFALILLFFLVASGDMFLSKAVQSFERFSDKRRAVEVLHAIEDRLGYYLGGITIINAGLGIAVAIAMSLWNLPGAVLLGFMAFGLNFVPFLGGLAGATIAAAIAFVSLEGTWAAAGVFGTYILLTSIEGQFITPVVISRRMRLNTTVVFLSVAFFAWIWSVMGMVVALPILIVLKIACDETQSLQTLARFLGDVDNGNIRKKADTTEE